MGAGFRVCARFGSTPQRTKWVRRSGGSETEAQWCWDLRPLLNQLHRAEIAFAADVYSCRLTGKGQTHGVAVMIKVERP